MSAGDLWQLFVMDSPGDQGPFEDGFWPPQWAENIPGNTSIYDTVTGNTYYFDAVIRVGHSRKSVITKHPVQTGASQGDHIYREPSSVVLEIAMSDAMGEYVPGQYSDGPTRSISAYQLMGSLQDNAHNLTLTTRLDLYENMYIEDIDAPDDHETLYGLKMHVTLRQIIMAELAVVIVSALPHTTGETPTGTVQPTPPTPQQGSILSEMIP